jgi:hypothetical protein
MSADRKRDESLAAFDRAYLLALDDHNQGVVKDIGEYMRLVPTDEHAELAALIAATLTPRTPASASNAGEFAEGYARAMSTIGAVEASAGPTGVLPGALESMSRARGIEPEQVVVALAAQFEIMSEEGLAALRRYYHRIRSGQLLGSRIAHRLLAALAKIFDAEPEDFIAAVRPVGAGPQLSVAPVMPRPAGGARRAAAPVAARSDLPHPDEELVKRLFSGGPDA